MASKGKDEVTQKSRVIYMFKNTQADCEVEYTGELARAFVGGFQALSQGSLLNL